MGRFVIVAYTPKDGMEARLLSAVEKHLTVLRNHNLVTDKQAHVMRAADGSIVEVFEWRSVESIDEAHSTPAVQDLWAEFGAVCEFTPLSKLAESNNMFAEFESIENCDAGAA